MAEKNGLDINRIRVVGELVEVDLKSDQASNGKDYVAGDFVVKSNVRGKEQLTTVNFFAFATTKKGKENSFYKAYSALEDRINERIAVDGEVEENRFYSDRNDQIVSINRNRAKFINPAKKDEEDTTSFEYGGFVVSPLTEKLDSDDNLIHYEIVIGQKDYSGDKPIYTKFVVRPELERAIEYMSSHYETGETVKVLGDIDVVRETVEKKEETAFGEDNVRTYNNVFQNYVVTRGSEPISGESKGEYDIEYIKELAQTYKSIGKSLKESKKDSGSTKKSNKKKGSKSDIQDLM